MKQDKIIKILIIATTGIAIGAITGIVIYALRKGKAIMDVDEIMAQLND